LLAKGGRVRLYPWHEQDISPVERSMSRCFCRDGTGLCRCGSSGPLCSPAATVSKAAASIDATDFPTHGRECVRREWRRRGISIRPVAADVCTKIAASLLRVSLEHRRSSTLSFRQVPPLEDLATRPRRGIVLYSMFGLLCRSADVAGSRGFGPDLVAVVFMLRSVQCAQPLPYAALSREPWS